MKKDLDQNQEWQWPELGPLTQGLGLQTKRVLAPKPEGIFPRSFLLTFGINSGPWRQAVESDSVSFKTQI